MDKTKNNLRYPWLAYFRNPLSIAGIAISLIAGLLHLSLLLLDFSRGLTNPYLNIWFHIVLPPIVVTGLILAAIGAWRERSRIKKAGILKPVPLSTHSRRMLFWITAGVVTLFIPFLGFTSYAGYNYTDSVEFCGQACHVPMQAVYTAYQVSAHARVPCASCHIGEGASWFVRSKLSGTRQVFATVFDTFDRPIKTPIKDLRPARETCERCHWPEKAFGSKVVDLPHYGSDEKNTYRPLSMVLKTEGGNPDLAPVRGIHWHLLDTHKTEYVAVDEQRLEIPWVKVVLTDRETGEEEVRVFRSDGLPADAPPPKGEYRTMDCLDCHNRPSHKYRTPDEILNTLFSFGRLDPSLPHLKREAGRLMAETYVTTPEAREAIRKGLLEFYGENHPETAIAKKSELEDAVRTVQEAFGKNIFPELKTDWRNNPDHIGHKYYPGCYRCHEGRHKADDGKVIGHDCTLCHDFMELKDIEGGKAFVQGGYRHPYELEESHKNIPCYSCHTGGPTPPPTCAGCHSDISGFLAGTAPILAGWAGEAHPHHDNLECIDCHEEAARIPQEEIKSLCTGCHDEEEEEVFRNQFAAWKEMQAALAKPSLSPAGKTSSGSEPEAPAALERLKRVHPIHNIGYALEILRRLGKAPNTDSE